MKVWKLIVALAAAGANITMWEEFKETMEQKQ